MADTNPVVTALAEYIEQNASKLTTSMQFNPTLTASEVTVIPGIKNKAQLHFMTTDVNLLAGGGCDRSTPTDATTFTDKTITGVQISIAENLCFNLLRDKYLSIYMKKGLRDGLQQEPSEIMPLYWSEKETLLSQALDTADWQGDTASLTNNLKRYDGWIKWIDAGSAVIGNTGGVTSITLLNVIAVFQAMVLAIPTKIRGKANLTLYAPMEICDLYGVALTNANLFHYKANGDMIEPMVHGTRIKLRPTFGLNGTDRMFLTYPENLVLGVDGEGDTQFTTRIDPVSNKRLFVDADFTRCTQIYFVEDVVSFDLTVS